MRKILLLIAAYFLVPSLSFAAKYKVTPEGEFILNPNTYPQIEFEPIRCNIGLKILSGDLEIHNIYDYSQSVDSAVKLKGYEFGNALNRFSIVVIDDTSNPLIRR